MPDAPRASALRRLLWWLRGGPGRLRAARARREAIYGSAHKALVLRFGTHVTTDIMVETMRGGLSPRQRDAMYRRAVLEHTPRGSMV